MMKKIAGVMMLALAGGTASAHLLFPAHENNGYRVVLWADDHWEDPVSQDMIGVRGYNADVKPVKVGFDFKDGKIEAPQGAAMMTAEYDFGYWTFTLDKKYFHKPRTEVTGSITDTRHVFKVGKGIFTWNDHFTKPIGMKVEVTPLSNPLVLKEGDKLKVLVTCMGKPCTGAALEDQAGDLDDAKVASDGTYEWTIRKPQKGFAILGATVKLPYQLNDSKAQTLQITGTLGFQVAK